MCGAVEVQIYEGELIANIGNKVHTLEYFESPVNLSIVLNWNSKFFRVRICISVTNRNEVVGNVSII